MYSLKRMVEMRILNDWRCDLGEFLLSKACGGGVGGGGFGRGGEGGRD